MKTLSLILMVLASSAFGLSCSPPIAVFDGEGEYLPQESAQARFDEMRASHKLKNLGPQHRIFLGRLRMAEVTSHPLPHQIMERVLSEQFGAGGEGIFGAKNIPLREYHYVNFYRLDGQELTVQGWIDVKDVAIDLKIYGGEYDYSDAMFELGTPLLLSPVNEGPHRLIISPWFCDFSSLQKPTPADLEALGRCGTRDICELGTVD